MKANVYYNSGRIETLLGETAQYFKDNCTKWNWDKILVLNDEKGVLHHIINLPHIEHLEFKEGE